VDVPEAETPTQTSSDLRLRASYFYPDRAFPDIVRKAIRQAYTRAGLPHARAYRPAKSPAPRSPPRSFSNPNARAWPSVWRSWRRHRDRGSGGREVVVIAQRSRNRAVTDKDQKTRWGKRIAQRYLGANALGSSSLPAPGQAASASRFRPFAAFAGAGGPRAAGAGRVRMWRGGLRCGLSVSAPFVWRCLTSRTITPFPHPSHRTGHAELPHPALGQDACLRPREVSCRPPTTAEGRATPSVQPADELQTTAGVAAWASTGFPDHNPGSLFASACGAFRSCRTLQEFPRVTPISRASPLSAPVLNGGPFPPPALPGFLGNTGLSATPARPL